MCILVIAIYGPRIESPIDRMISQKKKEKKKKNEQDLTILAEFDNADARVE